MPVIKRYNKQVRSPGPTDMLQATPSEFGGAQGQGLQKLGRAVSDTGARLEKYVIQKEVSAATLSMSEANNQLAAGLEQVSKNAKPGDSKPFEEYDKVIEDTLSKIGEDISTKQGKQYYSETTLKIKAHLRKNSLQRQSDLSGILAVQEITGTFNANAAATRKDPSSLTLQQELMDNGIDVQVLSGRIDAGQGSKLKADYKVELTKEAVRGWIDLNPDYAKQKINNNEFGDIFSGDQNKALIGEANMAIRGREAEKARIKKAEAEAKKARTNQINDSNFNKLQKNELGFEEISKQDIPSFGSGGKNQWYSILKKRSGSPGKITSNPAVKKELFRRVYLPDGHPEKITNPDELNEFYGNGLDEQGLKFLRKEVGGPPGDLALKKQFMSVASGALTKTNALAQIVDAEGDALLLEFMTVYQEEYAAQRKAGVSVRELLKPGGKHYLGDLIERFRKSPQQIIRDSVSGLRGNKPAAQANDTVLKDDSNVRREGESAPDYLARRKKAGK